MMNKYFKLILEDAIYACIGSKVFYVELIEKKDKIKVVLTVHVVVKNGKLYPWLNYFDVDGNMMRRLGASINRKDYEKIRTEYARDKILALNDLETKIFIYSTSVDKDKVKTAIRGADSHRVVVSILEDLNLSDRYI